MSNTTDTPRAELALTYRRAAQIVQARGLARDCYQQDNGAVCTVGALVVASGMNPDDYAGEPLPAVLFLEERLWLKSGSPDPVERIADWNDDESTTPADVVAALLDAARAIETREATALVPTRVLLACEIAA